MSLTLNSRDWTDLAKCKNMDKSVFFPNTYGGVKRAKAICATCPVSAECLQYATDNDLTYGVWGGLGEGDRERLAREARRAGF
jgi:WhiB family redox-sensing transcriptional regulator